ncbi:MAG: M48 family metallopeptidase [Bacteriovoracaceae bacterium]
MRMISLLLLVMMGCSSMTKAPSDADINAEAAKAYEEVKAKSKMSSNAEWNAMVNRVASRIAKASGENFNWEWHLIESPEVNAWCMPGGKIAVYTGIMPVLKTEGALAAVLGHEVAHATLRHGKEHYVRAMKENVAGIAVGLATVIGGQIFCKTDTCRRLTGLTGAAAGFALQFFDMKYSRGDESQADHYGQQYMAKAGYDPAEATNLWDRMSEANKGKAPPELLSTHPSDAHRKAALQESLPTAETMYAKAPQKYGTGEPIK